MNDRGRIVGSLGLIQILTWGSSFYLLAVLADPITQETGWGRDAVAAGVSLALLVAAASARAVARRIAAHGGRGVVAGGIAGLALGLAVLSQANHPAVYYLAWAIIGLGMAASLYEAAFTTLGTLMGDGARRAITHLSLVGGFASTICWPLSAAMVAEWGWRGVCLGYVALLLGVALPLCLWALPSGARGGSGGAKAPAPTVPLDARLWLLAVIAVSLTLVFSTLSVHLVTLLTEAGRSLAAAVALGALIGPAQVGARVVELLGGGRHPPILTQLAAAALIATGVALIWGTGGAWIALIAYGAGTGLYSIARGTVPLAAFGAELYPHALARIAGPALVAAAAAPILGAWMISGIGASGTLLVLTALALVGLAATVTLGLHLRRTPRP